MDVSPTFTFDWRHKEHAQVISLLVREKFASGLGRIAKWGVLAVLALATGVAGGLAFLGDLSSALQLVPWLLLAGAMTLGFGRVTGWIRAWQVQRQDPNVRHPLTHTFEESGLRVTAKTAETRLTWEGLHRVRETPDLFMFYYSKGVAYYLPKRVIPTQSEAENLRVLIKSKLPPTVPFQER